MAEFHLNGVRTQSYGVFTKIQREFTFCLVWLHMKSIHGGQPMQLDMSQCFHKLKYSLPRKPVSWNSPSITEYQKWRLRNAIRRQLELNCST